MLAWGLPKDTELTSAALLQGQEAPGSQPAMHQMCLFLFCGVLGFLKKLGWVVVGEKDGPATPENW